MQRRLMIGLLMVAGSAITACGDDDDESDVAEANTAFCETSLRTVRVADLVRSIPPRRPRATTTRPPTGEIDA